MNRRIVVIIVLALALAPLGWYSFRNPEERSLNAEARKSAPGLFVETSVGATHYELAGPDTGRVVVLVHGFSVPSYIWDSTFHALSAAGFRVLRYDLIGRGWSERRDIGYTPHDHGAQLRELLDSLAITEPVHLFGLSFGGLVASGFAAVFPERTQSLVLVDPVTRVRTLPRIVGLPVIGDFVWQTTVVPTMPAGQSTDFLHPERFPDWESRYREQMQYRGFGRALRRAALTQVDVDFPNLFARVAANGTPVLLVWGRQDQTTPFERHRDVTLKIPSAEFFPVDSSGHLPHMEQTTLVNARLLDFLARAGVSPRQTNPSPAASGR